MKKLPEILRAEARFQASQIENNYHPDNYHPEKITHRILETALNNIAKKIDEHLINEARIKAMRP